MADKLIDPSSIQDIRVRSFSSELHNNLKLHRILLEISSETEINAKSNIATVSTSITVRGFNKDEEDSNEEGTLLYEGAVALRLTPESSLELNEDDETARQISNIAWPTTRATLIAKAGEVGFTALRIPVSISQSNQ